MICSEEHNNKETALDVWIFTIFEKNASLVVSAIAESTVPPPSIASTSPTLSCSGGDSDQKSGGKGRQLTGSKLL